jgi:hypothetical protein
VKNSSHLPLLHTLLTEGKEAIRQKFGLPHSKIRWVSKGFLTLVSVLLVMSSSHLPPLHTLLTEGKEAIRQKFSLPHSKIRWVRVL